MVIKIENIFELRDINDVFKRIKLFFNSAKMNQIENDLLTHLELYIFGNLACNPFLLQGSERNSHSTPIS